MNSRLKDCAEHLRRCQTPGFSKNGIPDNKTLHMIYSELLAFFLALPRPPARQSAQAVPFHTPIRPCTAASEPQSPT